MLLLRMDESEMNCTRQCTVRSFLVGRWSCAASEGRDVVEAQEDYVELVLRFISLSFSPTTRHPQLHSLATDRQHCTAVRIPAARTQHSQLLRSVAFDLQTLPSHPVTSLVALSQVISLTGLDKVSR